MTNEDVLRIAALARLRLDPEELPRYAAQLESILEYVRKLERLDTEGVFELAHAAERSNAFRADEPRACEQETRRRIIDAFPRHQGDLLEVPGVFQDRTE